MIHLYDIGNENFKKNGDVILQPVSGTHRNVAGGNYDMTMVCPIDPEGKWRHIVPGAIVKLPVPTEVIENSFSGYDADIYKTNTQAEMRESPVAPAAITYAEWSDNAGYEIGNKVTCSLHWAHHNYQCTYWDGENPQSMVPPYASSWWKEIPDTTSGAAVLATLPAGTELYFVEDVSSAWYKLSTYYGLEGYVLKSQVTFDRHVSASENQPRVIKDQLFRLKEPAVDTEKHLVTVAGQHVSYDLAGDLILDVSLSQAAPAMAIGRLMEGLLIPYRGTIATNMINDTRTYTGELKGKNGIFALLDPDKGIVGAFGAKFTRDNWDMFVMNRTETDRGYTIRYGVNAGGINWKQSSASLVNRVVPVAKDAGGNDLYLPEKWVDSEDISDYPVIIMERLQVQGQVGKDKGTGDGSVWTEAELLDEMRAKAAERFTIDKADRIAEEVTIRVEMLEDTEEYAWLKGKKDILLYDTVTAENQRLGMSKKLFVSEIEYDFVKEKITAVKLSVTGDTRRRSVTGYNVANNSITPEKLTRQVSDEIVKEVVGIMPEYVYPEGVRPGINSATEDGLVPKGGTNYNKVWKTDGSGNPGWRDEQTVTGFIPTSEKGAAGGVAELDQAGKVPAGQLPSYVDDVLEYANKNSFPATGETGKIYVAIDTGKTYRWSGSAYIELSTTVVTDSDPTLAWGTRSKVASVAGTDIHVTMPANPNTDHYAWSDITGKPSYYDAKAVKSISRSGTTFTATCMDGTTFTFTQQDNDHYDWSDITNKPATATRWPSWSEVTSKPTFSGGTTTLAWGQTHTIANVGGNEVKLTMPANPNTDHYAWSDITSKPDTATRWPTWNEVTGKPSTYTPSSGSSNYIRRDAWWVYEQTHNADDLVGAATFVYSKHGGVTTGMLVDFASSDNSTYRLQIQGQYNGTNLYFRNRSGDTGGGWNAWKRVSNADETVSSISRSGTTFTATRADGTTFTFTQQDTNTTYSAGNGISLSGTTFSAILSKSGDRFGCIPWIETDGVMEVGKYIDFHLTDGDTGDRAQRITATSSGLNFSGEVTTEEEVCVHNNRPVRLYGAGPTGDSWIKFQDTNNTVTFIGIRRPISTYGPTYYDATSYWTMLHAGNYKDYGYLPQLGNYYGNTHNLNDVMCGMGLINGNTVNSPFSTSSDVGYFISFNVLSSYRTQIVIPYAEGAYTEGFWIRTYNDNGWKAWKFQGTAKRTEAIKSISRSGTTFTATRCDDTTFTFTQQDNNTWRGYQVKAYSSTFNIGAKGDDTFISAANGFGISTPSGYTPVAMTRVYCTTRGVAVSNFDATATGSNTAVVVHNVNAASGTSVTVYISILYLQT
jgi:phage minor structural protein